MNSKLQNFTLFIFTLKYVKSTISLLNLTALQATLTKYLSIFYLIQYIVQFHYLFKIKNILSNRFHGKISCKKLFLSVVSTCSSKFDKRLAFFLHLVAIWFFAIMLHQNKSCGVNFKDPHLELIKAINFFKNCCRQQQAQLTH